jgi:hypothetical protein
VGRHRRRCGRFLRPGRRCGAVVLSSRTSGNSECKQRNIAPFQYALLFQNLIKVLKRQSLLRIRITHRGKTRDKPIIFCIPVPHHPRRLDLVLAGGAACQQQPTPTNPCGPHGRLTVASKVPCRNWARLGRKMHRLCCMGSPGTLFLVLCLLFAGR